MMRQDCLMHRWPFLLLVDESGGFTRFTPPFSQAKSSWFPRQSWWRWTGERWRPTKMLGCKWIESGTEIWAGHFGKWAGLKRNFPILWFFPYSSGEAWFGIGSIHFWVLCGQFQGTGWATPAGRGEVEGAAEPFGRGRCTWLVTYGAGIIFPY